MLTMLSIYGNMCVEKGKVIKMRNHKTDILDDIKYGFYTNLEELEQDITKLGEDIEILEIDEEHVIISYIDDDSIEDYTEVGYELNTIYRNGKPSTITIGKIIER